MNTNNTFAPVALFVYNRPAHTKQVLDSLLLNAEFSQTDLFIFCDGPKNSVSDEGLNNIAATRKLVEQFEGAKSITITKSDTNKGLASSIISGITQVLTRFDNLIVLEDDIIVSPAFLNYMNYALNYFFDQVEVGCIHAYTYPVKHLPEYYFLRGADCWGWGTWKRAWNLFNPDGSQLLNKLRQKGLIEKFDYNGAYKFSEMLEQQTQGKNDSWAIRWHASLFLENRLTLYPGRSFVQNIGNDSSGTHSGKTNAYGHKKLNNDHDFDFESIGVQENLGVVEKISVWFRFQRSFLNRCIQFYFRISSKLFNNRIS